MVNLHLLEYALSEFNIAEAMLQNQRYFGAFNHYVAMLEAFEKIPEVLAPPKRQGLLKIINNCLAEATKNGDVADAKIFAKIKAAVV